VIGKKSKVYACVSFFGSIKNSQENDRTSQVPSMKNAWHIGGWSAIRRRNWSRVRERGVKKPLKSNLTRRGGCVGPLWSHKFARGRAIAGARRGLFAVQSDVALWLFVHAFQRLQIIHSDSLSASRPRYERVVMPRKMHTLALSLSLSLSLSRAMEFLGIGCEGRAMPLNIYRPREIKFCVNERAIGEPHELARKRGHYRATKLRIRKPGSLSRTVLKKLCYYWEKTRKTEKGK